MNPRLVLSLCIVILLLSACSPNAATPQRIASYPAEKSIEAPPASNTLVYNAYLEIEVASSEQAAERAQQMVNDLGGYLAGSHSWDQDGRKFISLDLAVPSARFNDLRRQLYLLGTLTHEKADGSPGGGSTYSTITVLLRQKYRSPLPAPQWSPPTSPRWDPTRTLSEAFNVFMTIFGFLVDILIWIVVVAGPFVLIGLGLRALFRHWRAAHKTNS